MADTRIIKEVDAKEVFAFASGICVQMLCEQ